MRKCDGDISKWFLFWDIFELFVYSNIKLVFVDKLNYLNFFFVNLVSEVIFGLFFIVVNYDEVVIILKRRFGNK